MPTTGGRTQDHVAVRKSANQMKMATKRKKPSAAKSMRKSVKKSMKRGY